MKKYALRAFVGVFFLVILPATVVYVASARTGVGLVKPWKDFPVPEYEVFNSFEFRWVSDHYILVAPELDADGMERIARDIVEREYVGKRRILFYFYTDPAIAAKGHNAPPHLSSAAYIWSIREGVQPYSVPAPRDTSGAADAYWQRLKDALPKSATPEQE